MRWLSRLLVLWFAVGCGAPLPGVPDGGDPSADGGQPDGGQPDSGQPDGGSSSRCTETAQRAECTSQAVTLTVVGVGRLVTFQVPLGQAPAAGWPTVLFFQGTAVPGHQAFAADRGAPWGQYHITRTVKALLDQGYAVVAPDALLAGTTYWQTNIPPWSSAWTSSADHALMLALFDGFAAGTFGPVDSNKLYAMGLSSGGYMTSRMAVSYPGKFRSLAVHSASYATCGPGCTVPTLPATHPPTLFLHGQVDAIVPIADMYAYRDQMTAQSLTVSTDVSPDAGHEWLESGAVTVPAWFALHP